MTPQTLHDAWLIITVIAALSIGGISVFLLREFRGSSRRWFFWSLAFALASIAIEHVSAEIKNFGQPPPATFNIALLWLIGRTQEAIVASCVLLYLVFGRNGQQAPAKTSEDSQAP